MLMFKIKRMKRIFYLATIILGVGCTTAEIPLAGAPVNRTITYKQDIQPIIFNNCLTCHSSVNPANGLILETYQQVKNSAQNGNLIARINDAANPMPQNGLLTADRRALFDKWKTDGYID
ncbi:conserved exported protein of unknown function [Tenacibaculum sp. 190130A14a]|uniref:Cytochrome c domain-containing protein n=2 Tax=Tenacibaculum polynesiense TaxID=3137857 RepID=A0ABM9PFZ0_9FLAO